MQASEYEVEVPIFFINLKPHKDSQGFSHCIVSQATLDSAELPVNDWFVPFYRCYLNRALV